MSVLDTNFYIVKANAETTMQRIAEAQEQYLDHCVVGQLRMDTRNEVTYRMMRLGWKVAWRNKYIVTWTAARSPMVTLMATT